MYFLPHVTEERKTEIHEKFNLITPGIKILSENNLTLLGAPLTDEATSMILDEKMEFFAFFNEELLDLHPHVALCLLKNCLWIPKLTFLLRCCPLFKSINKIKSMDKKIKTTLENILNIELKGIGEKQCFLPINFGGIGIRLISDLALPAFIASVHSTFDLIGTILSPSIDEYEVKYLTEAVQEWKSLCPDEEITNFPNIQKNWDIPIIKAKINSISSSSSINQARVLAITQHESGAWLKALPSPKLGTLLDKESLRVAIGLRIGVKICKPYTCVCGYPVNEYGLHGLSCSKNKGKYSLHAVLNDILKRSLTTVGHPPVLEPPGLIRKDGKRPDGITLTPWSNGKCLIWDVIRLGHKLFHGVI